jgi:hypothetical protein
MKKTTLWLLLAVMAIAISCQQDPDQPDNEPNTYTPPAHLSDAEIRTLLNEALQAFFNATELTDSETYTYTQGAHSTIEKSTLSFNCNEKKQLTASYANDGKSTVFTYVEDFTSYSYNVYPDNLSHQLTDAYWAPSRFYDVNTAGEAFNVFDGYDSWTVEGNRLVGTGVSADASSKIEVTLYADKTIHTLKIGIVYNLEETKVETMDAVVTYTAHPALPSGFTKSAFTPAKQHRLKVIWGEGYGENLFYTEYTRERVCAGGCPDDDFDGSIFLTNIMKYAPSVAGKKPVFYRDAAFTDAVPIGEYVWLSDNNTIFYVNWENR